MSSYGQQCLRVELPHQLCGEMLMPPGGSLHYWRRGNMLLSSISVVHLNLVYRKTHHAFQNRLCDTGTLDFARDDL